MFLPRAGHLAAVLRAQAVRGRQFAAAGKKGAWSGRILQVEEERERRGADPAVHTGGDQKGADFRGEKQPPVVLGKIQREPSWSALSKIHLDDAKGPLPAGDRSVVGIPKFGPDEGQVAGLMGGFGPAGEGSFLSRGQVLDVQIDSGATEARLEPGLDGPGHGGIHNGEQDPAVGLTRERPAYLGVGRKNGLRVSGFGLIELYSDGCIEGVSVELICQLLGIFMASFRNNLLPGGAPATHENFGTRTKRGAGEGD